MTLETGTSRYLYLINMISIDSRYRACFNFKGMVTPEEERDIAGYHSEKITAQTFYNCSGCLGALHGSSKRAQKATIIMESKIVYAFLYIKHLCSMADAFFFDLC